MVINNPEALENYIIFLTKYINFLKDDKVKLATTFQAVHKEWIDNVYDKIDKNLRTLFKIIDSKIDYLTEVVKELDKILYYLRKYLK